MKTFGNVSLVKEAIAKKYQGLIEEAKRESKARTDAMLEKRQAELDSQLEGIRTWANGEANKAYARILSEDTLAAKKDFEAAREDLINQIFRELEGKAEALAMSKEYIAFVKKNSVKDAEAFAGSPMLQKEFPGSKVDKALVGVRFQRGNMRFDFTIPALLSSQHDALRHRISEALFND